MTDELKKTEKVKKLSFALQALPSGPLSNIFSFFSTKELARMAVVSKYFLANANECDGPSASMSEQQMLSFAAGRNQELTALLAAESQLTSLQHMVLQSGQHASALQRQLSLAVRGEILAGRLSLRQALDQIDQLSGLSWELLAADLPLAKLWLNYLRPWQLEGLAQGFTLSELYADWMSSAHIRRASAVRSIIGLRELTEHQVRGLSGGYTLEQVTADWFRPIHADAAQNPYALLVPQRTEQQVLRQMLALAPVGGQSREQWRGAILMPFGRQQLTHFYIAAKHGLLAALKIMSEVGQFDPRDWRSLIKRPLIGGEFIGETPFFAAVAAGQVAIVKYMQQATAYSATDFCALMTTPLGAGPALEVAPFYAAVDGGCSDMMITTYEQGAYTVKDWEELITRPLPTGGSSIRSPFLQAAHNGRSEVIRAMQQMADFSKEKWEQLLMTPLNVRAEFWATPLYSAIVNNHVETVRVMLAIGGFTKRECRALFTAPLTRGDHLGITPVYMAVFEDLVPMINLLYELGDYSPKEFQTLMTTALTQGLKAGRTPFYTAVSKGRVAMVRRIAELGAYNPDEWQALIMQPLSFGVNRLTSPLYRAMLEGRVEVITVMKQVGRFPPTEWSKLISTELPAGDHAGVTLFYAAAVSRSSHHTVKLVLSDLSHRDCRALIEMPMRRGDKLGITPVFLAAYKGDRRTLAEMRRLGFYSVQEWWQLLATPLEDGGQAGKTPFFVMVSGEYIELIRATYDTCDPKTWRNFLLTPSDSGLVRGVTPLHLAVSRGNIPLLNLMRELGEFSCAAWLELLQSPAKYGQVYGVPPFFEAFVKGYVEVIREFRKLYTADDWRLVITAVLSEGVYAGLSPFFIAVSRGQTAVVTELQLDFTPARWQIVISKELEFKGDRVTVLSEALQKNQPDMLEALRRGGQYSATEWEQIMEQQPRFFTPDLAAAIPLAPQLPGHPKSQLFAQPVRLSPPAALAFKKSSDDVVNPSVLDM